MQAYQVVMNFKTDRKLTADEINSIADSITLQVLEPWDRDGVDIDVKTETEWGATINHIEIWSDKE
jgi:hypothetical protein